MPVIGELKLGTEGAVAGSLAASYYVPSVGRVRSIEEGNDGRADWRT